MGYRRETPFDSIENAQQYIKLLVETVSEARRDIEDDISSAEQSGLTRRLEALRIVQFKLDKLSHHLTATGRNLNDLRTLRRLLLEERTALEMNAYPEAG